jgi:peptide/nickel transport system permease protein
VDFVNRFVRTPSAIAGTSMLLLLLVGVLYVSFVSSIDPFALAFNQALLPPSGEHWFGTDNFGRDIFARVMIGAVYDLRLSLICVFGPMIVGVTIGLIAGYFGGSVDAALMRTTDILWAFPFYVLVLAIVGALGPGETNLYIAFFLVNWIGFARIARGETLLIARLEYVEAVRLLRFSPSWIIFRHVMPNAVTPAIVYATADVVLTVQAVAALSFFGLGIQPPAPEWGLLIVDSLAYMREAPWMMIFPGLAIAWVGFAFSLLGDGLAASLRPEGQ